MNIIKKSVEILIDGIIMCIKHNLVLTSYQESDLIHVSLEFNLDYLSSLNDEILEFNKKIEFDLDDVSNFMSLEIKKYDVLVIENKGVNLEIEFDLVSVIEEYKDDIINNENKLFDEVLERKCPNIIDDVNKNINLESDYNTYKIFFLNDEDLLIDNYLYKDKYRIILKDV